MRGKGTLTMILQHPRDRQNQQQGFSLVELLVAMAMAGIVMAAIYSTYKSQQDTYVAQEQVAEMQQNLRASLYQMGRDIRMAGFNPQRSPNVGGFTDIKLDGDDIDETTTNSTNIAFYMDLNAPGTPGLSNGQIDPNDNDEQIAYRFNPANNGLEKFRVSDDTWQTVADNIENLNFVYLDGDGIPVDPTTATNLPLIRSVQITVLARTGAFDRDFTNNQTYENQMDPLNADEAPYYWSFTAPGDNYRRRLLSTTILCRNMGI